MAGMKAIDFIQKGFAANVEVSYLKCIAKILKTVPALEQAMNMGGFGLKLGVNAKVNLTYDDLDDIKEHELLSKFIDMNLDGLLEQMGKDKEECMNYKSDEPDLSKSNSTLPDYAKDSMEMMAFNLKWGNAMNDLLKSINGKFSSKANFVLDETVHVQVKCTADGYGPAGALGMNIATMGMRDMMAGQLNSMANVPQ